MHACSEGVNVETASEELVDESAKVADTPEIGNESVDELASVVLNNPPPINVHDLFDDDNVSIRDNKSEKNVDLSSGAGPSGLSAKEKADLLLASKKREYLTRSRYSANYKRPSYSELDCVDSNEAMLDEWYADDVKSSSLKRRKRVSPLKEKKCSFYSKSNILTEMPKDISSDIVTETCNMESHEESVSTVVDTNI